MNTPAIIYKNLRQRTLSTILTACSIALGVGLVVAITSLRQQAQENFNKVAASYELIVGAKGSPLQLTLNTVYHLDVPVGNIPYDYYQTLKNDWRVQYAIPFALGDNYKGHRLVGTEPEYFKLVELRGGGNLTFAQGDVFKGDFQAVLGSEAARKTGLKLGDTFVAKHGVQDSVAGEEHDHDPFTVVGVLAPTGTPIDRVIFISLGSVDEIHEVKPGQPVSSADLAEQLAKLPDTPPAVGEKSAADDHAAEHDHAHEEKGRPPGKKDAASGREADHHDHDDDHAAGTSDAKASVADKDDHDHHEHGGPITEVTSVILKLKTPAVMFQFHREINRGKIAQAAYPGLEVQKLFSIVGSIDRALLLISLLVVAVAAVSILVAIYNSLNERRREIAVMRALGARRGTIFLWLLLEAAAISGLGALIGIVLGHAALIGLRGYAGGVSGLDINPWQPLSLQDVVPAWLAMAPGEAAVAAAVILLGALMGLLPAILAYRTNVSSNLSV
jgi:putative ABC transport system permease protein